MYQGHGINKPIVGDPAAQLENIQETLHQKGSIPNPLTQHLVSDAQRNVSAGLWGIACNLFGKK